MPRKNKTDKIIGRTPAEIMEAAVKLIIEEGMSIRQAAKIKDVKFQTLARYVKKFKENPLSRMAPNYKVKQIFPTELEISLRDYIIKCAKLFYGLSLKDCRQLAYELAIKNNLEIPESWHAEQLASEAWLKGFRQRFQDLSLRTPEGCSLGRAVGFNQANVNLFFDKLEEVMGRHNSFGNGLRVYNLDETGTMTVQSFQKVLAPKGAKQVSKVISAERGTLVTTCCFVGASGQAVPPVLIFPRVHYKTHMINGAPVGTLGLATKGGWMNSEKFVEVIQHFVKHTQSSAETPTLLIMDNHESHLCIEALDLCKANGVTVLTIPPHCTNKLQPLDVGLLKPFNTFYNSAVDSWMMSHPGEVFTIYNVASCVGEAYPRAMTPVNIAAAFRKTGIFPFNRHVFTEVDFLPCSVTDRPKPSLSAVHNCVQNGKSIPYQNSDVPTDSSLCHFTTDPEASDSLVKTSRQEITICKTYLSPEEIKGFPKRKSKETAKNVRRRGKTMIATDTPEKEELANRKRPKKQPKQKLPKKMLFESESDGSDKEDDVEYKESSDELNFSDCELQEELEFGNLQRDPEEGEFVLVQFTETGNRPTSSKIIYFCGKVLRKVSDNAFEIDFLRKSAKCPGKFIFPSVKDIATVDKKDIKVILFHTQTVGATKRQQSFINFDIKLDHFTVH